MDESSWQPISAAQRRRQRRLGSMLRHEQQSIRMALATVMHHSYKVHTENGAPRSQTTATRAREGEVHEQHYGLRAQKRPLPGRGRRLLRRLPGRRCEQPRSVTWLPLVLLSSLCRRWLAATPSTTPRFTSSWKCLSRRRNRWSGCGGLRGGGWRGRRRSWRRSERRRAEGGGEGDDRAPDRGVFS